MHRSEFTDFTHSTQEFTQISLCLVKAYVRK